VQGFARVLLKMRADYADFFGLPAGGGDFYKASRYYGFIVLGDLVSLRQIRVKVIFARKRRKFIYARVKTHARPDGKSYGFRVDNGQSAGVARAKRAQRGIGDRAGAAGARAKHFAFGAQLEMYFQPYYRLQFHIFDIILNMHSTYKQGMALSVGATVAGKIFSTLNSLLIAFCFGINAKTDIYFYLLLIAGVLNGWLQGANTGVVVPQFMHLRQKNARAAMGFANFFIYLYAALLAAVVVLCFAFPRGALGLISAFGREQISDNLNMAGLGALYFASLFMMTFLLSLAEAHKLFRLYLLTPLNGLLALLMMLCFGKIEAVMWGYTAAYIIIAAACLAALKKNAGWDFSSKRGRFGKKFVQDFWACQPNNAAWAALLYAPLLLISAWPAAVSAVSYARMISDSAVDVLASKINGVAKVKITAAAAAHDYGQAARTLMRTDILLMAALAPLCIFTSFYAPDIVRLLLMRGSFGAGDALGAAALLSLFILAVPMISLNNNFSNMLAALRVVKEVTPRYTLFAVVFTLVFAGAIKLWGPTAYPMTFLLLYALLMLIHIITTRQYAPFLRYGRHLLYLLKLTALSFLCAVLTALFCGPVFKSSLPDLLLNGSVFVLLNGAAFWLCGDIKKFKEAANLKWKSR
jgi:peptidoglycan biosynthesis protein MviN/MurJ (putative lipid II flippase)